MHKRDNVGRRRNLASEDAMMAALAATGIGLLFLPELMKALPLQAKAAPDSRFLTGVPGEAEYYTGPDGRPHNRIWLNRDGSTGLNTFLEAERPISPHEPRII